MISTLFLATSLLPGMFCAKLFLPEALRAPRRRGVVVGALCCGILVVEWGALLAASRCTQQSWFEDPVFPALFSNPAFLLILLAAVVGPEYALARYVASHMPQPDRISFVSERRKVTLLLADILCIESNDSEVTLHAVDGTRYRTRTRISQWERLLDERFVRIHRAWLVNAGQVRSGPPAVRAAGIERNAGRTRAGAAIASGRGSGRAGASVRRPPRACRGVRPRV